MTKEAGFRARTWLLPVGMSFLALVVTGAGAWIPSLWVDEAATASAVRREWAELFRLLENVDLVHGLYYVLLHGWTSFAGFSAFSLRFPSIVAVAVAVGLLTATGRRLGGRVLGVAAGGILLIMPRVQYAGTDARSYGLTILGSAASLYLLVRLYQEGGRRFAVLYSVVAAVTVLLSFYTAALFAVQALWVLSSGKEQRRRVAGVLWAVPVWLLPAGAIGWFASSQQFQIAWVRPLAPEVWFEVFFLQFFSDAYMMVHGAIVPAPVTGESFSTLALGVACWLLAVIGVAMFWRRPGVAMAAVSVLLPVVVLLGASAILGKVYYLPRYLSFTAPLLALLAALPFSVLHRRLVAPRARWFLPLRGRAATVGLASLLTLCAIPSYLGQRTEFGRSPDDDFRFVAQTVRDHAQPGEAFVVGTSQGLAVSAYPDAFDRLGDPTLAESAAQRGWILDRRRGIPESADRIERFAGVWLIRPRGNPETEAQIASLGYHEIERYEGTGSVVVKYLR